MCNKDDKKFNLANYDLIVPNYHLAVRPLPLSSDLEMFSVDCLEKHLESVKDWQYKLDENERMRTNFLYARKAMAIEFRRDVMNEVFPTLGTLNQDAIFDYILNVQGVEDSLNQKEIIFHALLGFRDLVSDIFISR